jgi:hypothetical protein
MPSIGKNFWQPLYAWRQENAYIRVMPPMSPYATPALMTLTAMPAEISSWKLEQPAYTWHLPETAEFLRQSDRGRVIQARFNSPGRYEGSVEITDARGSTAKATGLVELAEAEPFQIAFAPLFSNTLHREPLNISMRPWVTGGHPEDRLMEYEYIVDDPKATVINLSGSSMIKNLSAGERTVHLKATSKMGKAVETDYNITVAANQPPTCEIKQTVSGDYTWYMANCSDIDGRIASRRWYLDDKSISSGQTIRRSQNDPVGVLRFEAYDDAGAAYRETLAGSAG